MSTTRATPTSVGPTDLPTPARTRHVPVADLEAMLATDDDSVDTAVIPALSYRDAVEASAGTPTATAPEAPSSPAAAPVADEDVETAVIPALPPVDADPVTEPVAAPVTTPVGHGLRSRHASPESRAAVRRNLVAVCCVAVSVVLVGIAVGLLGGWIAVAAYTLLVLVAAVALRRVNARYAPRHSRYSPRHA